MTKQRHQALQILLEIAVAATLAGCRFGDDEAARPAAQAPATSVAGVLTISAESQAAIGLKIARTARREVRDWLPATGWLAVRPGCEVEVKAPVTGFITPLEGDAARLGGEVTKGQQLASLQVFLSPPEQAQLVAAKEEADVLIEQSAASLTLAEEQLKRLESNAAQAVAGTRLLELRETIARARAAEKNAREKLPFLPQEPYGEELHLKAVSIDTPLTGRLISLHAAPRQLVMQGEPLWTIADWSRLWIRVPVYVVDLPRIGPHDPANVLLPDVSKPLSAQRVDVPQAVEPGRQTLDLVYEIENAEGRLRPGQAVSVSLPLGTASPKIFISRSAVLWDGMGNTWVYVQTSATAFRRRQVELGPLLGDDVVVGRGLSAGDQVVSRGAESLFGEEFKWQIQAEGND